MITTFRQAREEEEKKSTFPSLFSWTSVVPIYSFFFPPSSYPIYHQKNELETNTKND